MVRDGNEQHVSEKIDSLMAEDGPTSLDTYTKIFLLAWTSRGQMGIELYA
jgi:hypothetical protein